MTLALDKNALRAAARNWALPEGEDARAESEKVCRRVEALEAFQAARVVMMYWPLSEREVNLGYLARAALALGKTVCVPRVVWNERRMDAASIPEWDERHIVRDGKGVPGPNPTLPLIADEAVDLVVAPGLAFDPHGGRLGRGGGFYDRFLVRVERAARVGVAFDGQIIAGVPMDRHDVYMHVVVTPSWTIVAPPAAENTGPVPA